MSPKSAKGKLRKALKKPENVVAVIGSGVSMAVTNNTEVASWQGLLRHGLQHCRDAVDSLTPQKAQAIENNIESGEPDDLLMAAERIAMLLDAPAGAAFREWLEITVGALQPRNSELLHAIADLGVPILTTNYDTLLEDACRLRSATWLQEPLVEATLRGEARRVIHLHGHWDFPESIVLGVQGYTQLRSSKHVQSMLQAIAAVKTLLFIGVGGGMGDPTFDYLRMWMTQVFDNSSMFHHYRLCIESERDTLDTYHAGDQKLEVLAYGDDYEQLAKFLRSLAPKRPPWQGSLPPKPRCFGRGPEVKRLVSHILKRGPHPIAILGGPGIGKSTALLKALHDKRVEKKFARRLFVRCDGLPSLEAVVARIVGQLRITPAPDEEASDVNELGARLLRELERAPTVLGLDNAERLWRVEGSRFADFLATVADIKNVALVVSFRGFGLPLGVPWQDSIQLDRLKNDAARKTFLATARKSAFEDDPDLAELLKELDGVPLALVLVASLAPRYENLGKVLELWRQHKLPLPALDNAMAVSADPAALHSDAKRLLSLLGILPVGVAQSDLEALLPGCGSRAQNDLLELGLAFQEHDRLRVFVPVREYVVRNFSPQQEDRDRAIAHYLDLASQFGKRLGTNEGAEVLQQLGAETGNIESILLLGLEQPDPTAAINAAQNLAATILYSGQGTSRILEKACTVAERRGDTLSQAHCYRRLGDIAMVRASLSHATQRYEQARVLYEKQRKPVLAAECTQSLAEIALTHSEYDVAAKRLAQALEVFRSMNELDRQARSLNCLGDVERALYHRDAAHQYYDQARKIYQSTGNDFGRANCLQGFAHLRMAQRNFDGARAHYWRAENLYKQVGDTLGRANCIKGYADVAREKRDFPDAISFIERAREYYARLRNELGLANCDKALGDVALSKGLYQEARNKYGNALLTYRRIGNRHAEAFCLKSRADAELDHPALPKSAERDYQQAQEIFERLNDRIHVAACIKGLGDVARMNRKLDAARNEYERAEGLFRQEQDKIGEASCLRALGDLERSLPEGGLTEARDYYERAVGLLDIITASYHHAICLHSLGEVEIELGDITSAKGHLETALGLFAGVPDQENVARVCEKLAGIETPENRDRYVDQAIDAWLNARSREDADRVRRTYSGNGD